MSSQSRDNVPSEAFSSSSNFVQQLESVVVFSSSSNSVQQLESTVEEAGETLNVSVCLPLAKHVFEDEPETYQRYLKLVEDFKDGAIPVRTLCNMLCDLFKGFEDVIKFTEKLKAQFLEHDPELYTSFQTILNQYGQGNKSIDEMNDEVLKHFKDHSDLRTEFLRIQQMIPGKKNMNEEGFKLRTHSRDEKVRFKIEDDMFEFDTYLVRVKSTINSVQELLEKIENNEIAIDDTFKLENHLSSINLRCIEQLYGEQGLELLDVLNNNGLHLTIVLRRLREKYEEMLTSQTNFRNKCRKIIDGKGKVYRSRAAISMEEIDCNAIVFDGNSTTIPHKLFRFI